jgi:hypothetical protein
MYKKIRKIFRQQKYLGNLYEILLYSKYRKNLLICLV